MGTQSAALLRGTLDLLILKALATGELHGLGVSRRNRADHRRHVSSPTRLSLSGTTPSRRSRVAVVIVGCFRQQSPRQVPHADEDRQGAAVARDGQLESHRAGDRSRLGGLMRLAPESLAQSRPRRPRRARPQRQLRARRRRSSRTSSAPVVNERRVRDVPPLSSSGSTEAIGDERPRCAGRGRSSTCWGKNLRYGARLLRRNPLFTLTAVLSLAIGIGATTSIFTVAKALLLPDCTSRHRLDCN